MSIDNVREEDEVGADMVQETVDLTNCDREPIHIPGLIQPHGVLLALEEATLTIIQASQNTEQVLGIAAERLLHKKISVLLSAEQAQYLEQCVESKEIEGINPIQLNVRVEHHGQEQIACEGVVHRVDGGIILLELELVEAAKQISLPNFYHVMRNSATVLQGAANLDILCQSAAEMVKQMTGFDRIMIYRFHEDWHGEVIAEARSEGLEPYLGLHYPASDIPAQARELYRHNWLRLIADVQYTPSPIIPTLNPLTQVPLDLSQSVLRSVSPMHIQYLKNMGVGASMSVSIIKGGELWGLISCHHTTARYVAYTVRMACEFLGQLLSLQIAAREDVDDYAYDMKIKDIQARMVAELLQSTDVSKTLQDKAPELLELTGAQGVACFIGDTYVAYGQAPDEMTGLHIVEWLQQSTHEDLFVTDTLPTIWSEGQTIKAIATGLLAIRIAPLERSYVLWFRPELVRIVKWGGDPEKPVQTNGGIPTLHPRTSFAAWSQTVYGKSHPWQGSEINAARVLRGAIVDRMLRNLLTQRSEELTDLNRKLAESNQELDSFAYIVSHDLKEPLRGINNYVHILREDYGQKLDESGRGRLQTLLRLTQRLDHLIDSLLQYSRVGRIDLAFAETDLNEILERSIEMLRARIEESGVKIKIPQPLPSLYCDRVRVGEIFANLISNAIKYNDKVEKWIEIGYSKQDHEPSVFYIRDNGIGIRDKYFDAVFRIFRRLHGRDAYGGGTGAGLTIVKRIVERHGGRIWVESTYGEGTTFYFTLQQNNG